MNRRLQYANLAGVLALAILCVVQWQRDRGLNLERNRLEKARIEDAAVIRDREKTVRGLTSDLALFKEQISTTRSELGETLDRLRQVESDNTNLATERDQLKESLTNWMAAVSIRDQRINEANQRIQGLAEELNRSIRKFNELAAHYNNGGGMTPSSGESPTPDGTGD